MLVVAVSNYLRFRLRFTKLLATAVVMPQCTQPRTRKEQHSPFANPTNKISEHAKEGCKMCSSPRGGGNGTAHVSPLQGDIHTEEIVSGGGVDQNDVWHTPARRAQRFIREG